MKTSTKTADDAQAHQDPAGIEPATETAETHNTGAGQAVTLYPGQSGCDLSDMAFEELDRVVQKGALAFVEVGHALAEIKDRKLWKGAGYESWTTYAGARLGKSGNYADRQIRSAKIMSELVPIGTNLLPTCEAQVRPLTKLETADERRQVWDALAQDAAHAPTGKEVEAAVNTYMGKALPQKKQAAVQTPGGDAAGRDGREGGGMDVQEATANGDAAATDADNGEEADASTTGDTGAEDNATALGEQPAGETFTYTQAEGETVVVEGWVEGVFTREALGGALSEIAKKMKGKKFTPSEGQWVLANACAAINGASSEMEPGAARQCGNAIGNLIWKMCN